MEENKDKYTRIKIYNCTKKDIDKIFEKGIAIFKRVEFEDFNSFMDNFKKFFNDILLSFFTKLYYLIYLKEELSYQYEIRKSLFEKYCLLFENINKDMGKCLRIIKRWNHDDLYMFQEIPMEDSNNVDYFIEIDSNFTLICDLINEFKKNWRCSIDDIRNSGCEYYNIEDDRLFEEHYFLFEKYLKMFVIPFFKEKYFRNISLYLDFNEYRNCTFKPILEMHYLFESLFPYNNFGIKFTNAIKNILPLDRKDFCRKNEENVNKLTLFDYTVFVDNKKDEYYYQIMKIIKAIAPEFPVKSINK